MSKLFCSFDACPLLRFVNNYKTEIIICTANKTTHYVENLDEYKLKNRTVVRNCPRLLHRSANGDGPSNLITETRIAIINQAIAASDLPEEKTLKTKSDIYICTGICSLAKKLKKKYVRAQLAPPTIRYWVITGTSRRRPPGDQRTAATLTACGFFVCVSQCLSMWSFLMKPLPHVSHAYGFCPVCRHMCLLRSVLWLNCFGHRSHL